MRDYKKYKVWELGHEITLEVYRLTKSFPEEELYGMTSQMRRAAYSIPSNIVEGCGRESDVQSFDVFSLFLKVQQVNWSILPS